MASLSEGARLGSADQRREPAMRIAVLGTGVVGRTLASVLADLGHNVATGAPMANVAVVT
jgi:homoserine dehydrogenase